MVASFIKFIKQLRYKYQSFRDYALRVQTVFTKMLQLLLLRIASFVEDIPRMTKRKGHKDFTLRGK